MQKTMRDILYEKINNYQKVEINSNTTLQDLENLGEGTFIIDKFPSIELIKQFPAIFNCTGEVGLEYIEGVIILTISKKRTVNLPTDFRYYVYRGVSQFSLHSHPSVGPWERYPSLKDIEFYMRGNIFYIVTDTGLLEVDIASFDKTKDIEIEFEKFMNGGVIYEDPESLYYYFYKSVNIKLKRYTEEEDIKNLINKNISRKIDFWDEEAKVSEIKTPYPGKRKQ